MKKLRLRQWVKEAITYTVMVLLIFGGMVLISVRNDSLNQKKTEMSETHISQN